MIKEKENGETEIKESKTNIVKSAKKGFSKLALLKDASELDEIVNLVPDKLKEALKNLQNVAKSLEYKNLRIVPLYYSKMRYYDSLFFDWDKIDDEKLGFDFCYLLYFLPSFTDSMASLCHCASKWWKLFCPVSYC